MARRRTPAERLTEIRMNTSPTTVGEQAADGSIPITGYPAVFNSPSRNLGGFVERIAPGAFAKTLQEADVRLLLNHDPNFVLARSRAGTLRLLEDEHGLQMEADMAPTSYAKDLAILLKRGDVSQMSFMFQAINDDWDERGAIPQRTVREARLMDVSIVTFPAYEASNVALRSQQMDAILETMGVGPDDLDPVEREAFLLSLSDGRPRPEDERALRAIHERVEYLIGLSRRRSRMASHHALRAEMEFGEARHGGSKHNQKVHGNWAHGPDNKVPTKAALAAQKNASIKAAGAGESGGGGQKKADPEPGKQPGGKPATEKNKTAKQLASEKTAKEKAAAGGSGNPTEVPASVVAALKKRMSKALTEDTAYQTLQGEAASWFASLKPAQRQAVSRYQGEDFRPINRFLRKGKPPLDERRTEIAETLKDTLNHTLSTDVLLNRGMALPVTDLKAFVGKTIVDNGFTSTSTHKSVSDRFVQQRWAQAQQDKKLGLTWENSEEPFTARILVPQGSKVGWLGGNTSNSYGASEREVLLPPGGKYHVVGIKTPKNEAPIVDMIYIPPTS